MKNLFLPEKMKSTNRLETITAADLIKKEFDPVKEIIQGFLTPGLYVLAGAPKAGKSFMSLQLAHAVSTGTPFLEHATLASDVLYLALEDSEKRIQQRILESLGDDAISEKLHIAVKSKTVTTGLINELDYFLMDYPNTSLIIIDTLAKIRSQASNYTSDYAELGQLKEFADRKNICILLIHHTIKTKNKNPFTAVSGSQGINGVADGTLVLIRSDNEGGATLYSQGRDIQYSECHIGFDSENLQWNLDKNYYRNSIHPFIQFIGSNMIEPGESWQGSATELFNKIPQSKRDEFNIKVNNITKILNKNRDALLSEFHVEFSSPRKSNSRTIKMKNVLTPVVNDDDGPIVLAS